MRAMSELTTPTDAARQLREVLDDTESDFASMPFFVRPMVKRGFVKRTGRSLEQWRAVAASLGGAADAAAARGRHPDLIDGLARLADNYRTAPERAGKAMKGPALERVKVASTRREQAVRAVIDILQG